jgi:hypothetical protein
LDACALSGKVQIPESYTPELQACVCVCAIQELLDFLPPDAIQPILVFTGVAEFKTTIPDGVFTLAEFPAYVERQATEIMSANRVQFCVGRLETARLAITRTTDVEHVQQLRSRYGNDE